MRLRLFFRASVAAAFVVSAVPASVASAQPSTSWWSNVDLTNIGEGPLPVGALDAHLAIAALGGSGSRYEVVCPALGRGCGTLAPPTPYDTRLPYFAASLALDFAYGVTRGFAIEAHLPLHIYVVRPVFSTTAGAPIHEREDLIHHPETDVGVSDPWLGARYVVVFHHLTSTARLGLSVPLGSTAPNPDVLAVEGLWQEHVQFGSGTVMPIIGAGLAYQLPHVIFDARAAATLSFYEDGYGYKAPSQLFPTIHATVPLFSHAFQPYAAVDLPVTGPTRWSILPPGFTTFPSHATLLAGGGFFWGIRPPIYWDFNFRIHVANIGPGPTYPGTVSLGIGGRFDGTRAQPPAEPMHEY